ncbi:TauD/TfdA family dioxygenase [Altererythrobacter sp. ZODW24]|uniref:TauD/TfdA family dioxygenase n=1 Tax=Altererythrobacter sp. ZODW24 TaxID=2185142 RepID=UPI000DF7C70B|nr:TauD/TfdA family dioxygenase [Altererythrobacter sp. ZODW24]
MSSITIPAADTARFPAVIIAENSRDLGALLVAQKTEIQAQLAASGAVLFRGFEVLDALAFDTAVAAYDGANFPYAESLSNAVRVNVTPRVFTANEAPPETSIYLHHEMAQTPIYPSALFFYCEIAPSSGGATPLCRSDWLLERLEAERSALVADFAGKGVKYSHTMPGADDAGSGQGRSWRSTLGVDDKAAAENRLSKLGYSYEWQPDGAIRVTSARLDAIRNLPDGRRSFFNQLIAAYRGWADAEKSVSFGDGSPIDPADMAVAIRLADELSYDLQWQAGDVALIDNYAVMHGRRPFTGKRRVLASLLA